jgi:hypothetical protein
MTLTAVMCRDAATSQASMAFEAFGLSTSMWWQTLARLQPVKDLGM